MSGDYVERLEAFLDRLGTQTDVYTAAAAKAIKGDLRAALDELERLRTRQVGDNHVFVSGWYAHAEACASLGWDAREAAWRKYREEMTATLAKAERDGKVAGQ